ncbi:unnamed protein product [Arabis nemorensis]|uniref:Uncharacterized protein n=1 Tax=Arabis nemorensis TaxID=586526 RepID=A0A565BMD3_9BRAS|nr:unnamed protein product [Arabis nemorensis]
MYAQGPDLNQEMKPKPYGDEKLIKENKLDQKPAQGDFKPLQLESTNQEHDRGVITCLLLKEEPPDASLRVPASNEQTMTQGNLPNPQRIRNTNLTYLRADPTILRTKFSQGGGYDKVIRPVAELELHKTYHTSRIGVDKDTFTFSGAY